MDKFNIFICVCIFWANSTLSIYDYLYVLCHMWNCDKFCA